MTPVFSVSETLSVTCHGWPEYAFWYDLTQKYDFKYLEVARNGTVVYGRPDMPDDFAYIVAKALDEQQELFPWNFVHFSYN